jgi:hypothetical protein
MNQVITDYITPALPIWSYKFAFDVATPIFGVSQYFGYYPYNPQKSVYDRLWITAFSSRDGVNAAADFELSFDTGASWTGAFPSLAASGLTGFTYDETWNLGVQVATFQWIGLRHSLLAASQSFSCAVFGFLYRSTDTPF